MELKWNKQETPTLMDCDRLRHINQAKVLNQLVDSHLDIPAVKCLDKINFPLGIGELSRP